MATVFRVQKTKDFTVMSNHHLKNKDFREKIIQMKGKAKYIKMLENLVEEDKIYKTNETIIPNFLRIAINDLMISKKMLSN